MAVLFDRISLRRSTLQIHRAHDTFNQRVPYSRYLITKYLSGLQRLNNGGYYGWIAPASVGSCLRRCCGFALGKFCTAAANRADCH